jgi:peptidoglycan/xylan/chitin deacetylase (PgdA/CDA1 family)
VAEVIRRGRAPGLVATFTFDAGSDAGYTSQILDTLAANGIRGAFGITGRWAERNPELIQRIASAGHEFINHGYDHASFTGLSTNLPPLTRDQRWQQLDQTEGIINQLTSGSTLPYFRPPYGDYDASVNEDVGARGYQYNIMWTVDSRGWLGIPASDIVDRCLSMSEPGAIYVFHVGSASQDGPALQSVIDGLRAAGYTIVSLRDVLTP